MKRVFFKALSWLRSGLRVRPNKPVVIEPWQTYISPNLGMQRQYIWEIRGMRNIARNAPHYDYEALISVLASWSRRLNEMIDSTHIAENAPARFMVKRFIHRAGLICDWSLLDHKRYASADPRFTIARTYRRCKGLLLFILLAVSCARAQYATLVGTIQSSNGLPASNFTMAFTPTQFGFIAGTGVVVNTTTYCATSTDGSVVGIANPLQGPQAFIGVGGGGTLPAGNYYIEIAYYTATGVTLVGPEVSIQLGATGSLAIQIPTNGLPAGASGMNVYIGSTSGGETLQGQTTGAATFNQTVPLVTGAALPATNTTACKQVANDVIWPFGTGYLVSLSDTNGNTIPGYPMTWQLLGAGTTINLSNGLPYYHGIVTFPTPIVASPFNHATQSIAGGLSITGPLSVTGAFSVTSAVFGSLNQTKLLTGADQSGGTDSTAAFQTALASLTSGQTLLIPSGTYLISTYTNYQWHDKSNVLRPTALTINGLSHVSIVGLGQVNFVSGGTAAERVIFGLTGNNSDIAFRHIAFNAANVVISEPGTTYLATENFYPFELEGCTDCQFDDIDVTAARDGIMADAFNGVQNTRLSVKNSRFHSVVNYDILTRNVDGLTWADNVTDHNGRDWNTSTEDVAISDNTRNYNVGPHTSLYPYGTNSRVTPSLTSGPGTIHDIHKYGQGVCVELFSASQVTIANLDCTNYVAAISSISRTANVVTVNTAAPVYLKNTTVVMFTGVTDASFTLANCTSVTPVTQSQFTCTQAGANASSSGGFISDNYGPILFTDSGANTGNAQISVTGGNLYNGGPCIQDYFPGAETKDGLTVTGLNCYNTQGMQITNTRTGVSITGGRQILHSSGQAISIGGVGSKFSGVDVVNGYISNNGQGSEQIIEGNYFKGNFTTPIAILFNICASTENQIFGNQYEPSSYTNILNQACGAGNAVGFRKLDVGLSAIPSGLGVNLTCGAVGDTIYSDFPSSAGYAGWVCTTAGTPGTWSQIQMVTSAVTGYHGSSGTKVQLSDNTGASGNCAKFAADGSVTDSGAPCGATSIANIQITTGTTLIAANTCTGSTATTMTGLLTTSAIVPPTPTSDTSAVTGWGATGGLSFTYTPTANTFNWRVCNTTGAGITPGASLTWNVGAR